MNTESEIQSQRQAIVDSVQAGRMPPTEKLSDADIKTLKDWSEGGSTAFRLSAEDPTWHGEIRPLIHGKCAYCHSGKTNGTPPSFVTYEAVSTHGRNMMARMLGVGGDKMPPPTAMPRVSGAEMTMFQTWFTKGKKLGTPPPAIDVTKPVTYTTEIAPILKANCTACHYAGGRSPDLTTYATAKAAGPKSLSYVKVKLMPKAAPLTANEIAAFQKWADLKYPESATSVPTAAPTIDPMKGAYYNDNIKNLLTLKCTTCHKANGQAPDLSTFETAKAAGALSLNAIQSGRMPSSGKLPDEHIALFKKWVDNGYPMDSSTPPLTSTPPTEDTLPGQDPMGPAVPPSDPCE